MRARKSWRQKLTQERDLPKTEPIPTRMQSRWGRGTMVVPSPQEVDDLIRTVPKGKVVRTTELRTALAKRHHTDIACPLTTGLFAVVAAHAALEAKDNTPWWRVLKLHGELNPKFPGGIATQRALLEQEGHVVDRIGMDFVVRGFEMSLLDL